MAFTYQALPMRGVLGAGALAKLPIEVARRDPYANPRPVTPDGVEALLCVAWTGAPPPTAAPAVRTRLAERRSRT